MNATSLKKINKLWVRVTIALALVVILGYFSISVLNKKPITIGFVAKLTGKIGRAHV